MAEHAGFNQHVLMRGDPHAGSGILALQFAVVEPARAVGDMPQMIALLFVVATRAQIKLHALFNARHEGFKFNAAAVGPRLAFRQAGDRGWVAHLGLIVTLPVSDATPIWLDC